jgi:hypothetical protein
MYQILSTHTIIKSKKQPYSLKKILTNAKLHSSSPEAIVKKCGRPNCGTCPHLQEGSEFHFKQGQIFKIKNDFTCSSENLIYVITCSGCGDHYIGQTGNGLRQRITVHKQQIRFPEYRQIPLSEHIETCAGNRQPNFRVFPLYLCSDNFSNLQRINKENMLIEKYRPRLNMNI